MASNEKVYSQSRPLVKKTVRVVDYTEALAEANAQRSAMGLPVINWQSAPIANGEIKYQHMNTLRSAAEGLVKYGSTTTPNWTDNILTDASTIRACHMEEVRQVIDDRRNNARCSGCSTACYRGCSVACYSTCDYSCADNCSYACVRACSGTCGGGCSNCCTGCNKHCRGGYTTTNCNSFPCQSNCTGYCVTGCSSQCYTGCVNGCYSSCAANCSTSCSGDCNTNCNTSCGGSCYSSCNVSCLSGCANSSRRLTDAGVL